NSGCGTRRRTKRLASSRPYFMQFVMSGSEREFWEILAEELKKPSDPMSLVYPREVPIFDKYDEYLPESLVKKGFACGVLDIEGMKEKMLQLCRRALAGT
ncbi:MAG: ATP-dependent helicase, partial [Lachnospiraceae bacterium]|nr:ATP-dependent helicase [Lachnospiraceae bacterium]